LEQSDKFKEIFEKSPIGILFYNREGKLIDANKSALEMAGIPQFEDVKGTNLFDNPYVKAHKEELVKNELIKFQAPLDFDNIKKLGFYTPTHDGTAFIDFTISITNSGFLAQLQDITEQKKDEIARIQSERKLRTLIDELPVGISILGQDRKILFNNNTLKEILELSKDDINKGKYVERKYIKSDMTEMNLNDIPSVKAFNEQKPVKDIEVGIMKEDKSIIWTNVSAIPLSFSDWNILAVTSDITKRKRAEEELKESEMRYRSLFKNNHAIMLLIDPETGNIVDANPAALSFYGYSLEEIKKMKITDINIITEGQVFEEMQEARAEKKNYFTFKHRLSNGEIRYVDNYSGPITFKGKELLYSIIHDVNERKRLEKELIKAHAHLEEQVEERTNELLIEKENLNNILNTTKSGVYIINSDYELEYVNPVIEKDFGHLKGEKCYEYFYNKQDICLDCKIKKAFKGNTVEWEQYSPKSNKTYDASATPIIKSNGSISVVVFLYDVTRRDNAEKQLKETISELERSNEELQSFAYITSHDLQEPLRTMASYAQLLKRRYKGQLGEDADEFIDYIVAGSTRMKQQIQGLLEYSRVGTRDGDFWEFNALNALKHALSNLSSSIDDYNAEITYDSLPTIMGDETQIIRVFQNLIGNALKFRRAGVQPKIHISVQENNDEYIFSVSDNGIGIELQYTDRIFEVFKRLHAIGEFEGSGIGLAIVKRIIDRHGGRVWVKSEFGVGSTFYFTIPIVEAEK